MTHPSATDLRPVPLLDLDRENSPLSAEIAQAMEQVVQSGRFVLGPPTAEFEAAIAERLGCKSAVGCASGSDALLLCMMALDIGPGDEVLLPTFTFFATASAVRRLGATPVFVDSDPSSFNIDVADAQAKITPQTKAIIPVHLFGRCADLTAIQKIADAHGLAVIEDCAQSIDATHAGKTSGTVGLAGCFSFYPTKNLGGFGDAGLITTSDEEFAEKLRVLRGHGMKPRYYHSVVGINSRLDSLQAATLLVKLPHLDEWTQRRQANAAYYRELFTETFSELGIEEALDQFVRLPTEDVDGVAVWNQFTVRVANGSRDELRASLQEQKIGCEIYYPLPLHLQDCFADLGCKPGDFPVAEQASREVLSLPVFPFLERDEQQRVVQAVGRFVASARQGGLRKVA